MKCLLTLAAIAAFSLGSASSGVAQGVQFQVGPRGLSIGSPYQNNGYGYNSYGNRLNRYNNYNNGYNNYGYGNRGRSSYRNYDYYGRNRGRVNDYRNYYQSTPYTGYNRWYNSRPGISIGNGRAGFYYSF